MNDPYLEQRLTALLGRTPNPQETAAAYMGLKHAQGADALWVPMAKVLKYGQEKVAQITAQLGFEPKGYHLRELESSGHIEPDEVTDVVGNLLTTAGLNRMTSLILGSGAAMTNAQTFSGVGDSSTAATVADTTLGASSNKWYKATDATYPSQANGVITNNTTFQTGEANYAWNEWVWGIATGTLTAGSSLPGTSPVLINHKIQSMGTKVSGSIWTLQGTVTIV